MAKITVESYLNSRRIQASANENNMTCAFPSRLLLLAVMLCFPASYAQASTAGDGATGSIEAQHLTAKLIAVPAIAPGGSVQAGLKFTLDEHWHLYWINAGDSGQSPSIQWSLPGGFTASPMRFPAPKRLPLGPFMDFGYEDTVIFPMVLNASPETKAGVAHLKARVSWLVCREVCIPGRALLGLDLRVAAGLQQRRSDGELDRAARLIPTPLPAGRQASISAGQKYLTLTLGGGQREEHAEFYPIDPDQIANAADQPVEPRSTGLRIRLTRAPEMTSLPTHLHGILKLSDTEAYEINPQVFANGTPAVPKSGFAPVGAPGKLTAITAAAFAFLGGIILNLMPCVFPVLFLKGLALVQSSREERNKLRRHGIMYTLGILVSFWVIVGVLLILRASGRQAGWGFQLQSPVFIGILASFLFFLALSLAGQFDFGLSITGAGSSLAQKQGYTGSFFTGVLATVVATPCMGPFLGAAVGFALAESMWITFVVFTSMALGLALPYLLLTAQPAWTRILPRPGAWMQTLKQLTAVPLFATVIWLTWIYGRLFPSEAGAEANHIARILASFLVLAIAGWALGRWPARWSSGIAALVLCVLALAIPISKPKAETLQWKPYTVAALDEAREQHQPVFIDFTAAWCLSCQYNERTVLNSAEVEHQLASKNFALLRADWTQYDSTITKELASIGRSGVPTYVIYPGEDHAKADVLPELLTKTAVVKAIERDTK